MECCAVDGNGKKRAREEAELQIDSPESKRANSEIKILSDSPDSKRVNSEIKILSDSPESKELLHELEVNSPESDGAGVIVVDLESPEAKQIREDLLDILDDADANPGTQELDSVIKSFEEEILQNSPQAPIQAVFGLAADSGEPRPELGYLLEASDDELGLPPTLPSSDTQEKYDPVESAIVTADAVGLGSAVGLDDELPNFDSYEFGVGVPPAFGSGNDGEFVSLGGLFDYSEPSDFSEFSWRPESLPAL